MFLAIPEKNIKRMAEYEMDSADSSHSFIYMLKIGSEYKEAGLTPMYLLDIDKNCVMVTSEERIRNELH